MTAIGQILNMSRDRVRTLEHKALKALRERSNCVSDYV
jgi:DNA-directed RNA polymerase sigma subunit (sigma70/sigma32)